MIKLDWVAHLSLEKKAVDIPFKDLFEQTSDEHNESQPLMSLLPKKRITIKIPDWLNLVLPNLSSPFYKKLSEEWELGFCEPLTAQPAAPTESLLRCTCGAEKEIPINVNSFFKEKIGLNLEDWKNLEAK